MVRQPVPRLLGRLCFYACGLVILCIGIILSTKASLGVAPVNSLPYLSSEISPLTLGQSTTVLYLICIAAQCTLKRKLSLPVLLQLPLSYLFGLMVDFFNRLLDVVQPHSLPASLLWLVVAISCIALGVVMVVGMDLVPNPPDGMVQTISQVSGREFGLVKNIFAIFPWWSFLSWVVCFSLTRSSESARAPCSAPCLSAVWPPCSAVGCLDGWNF